MDPKIKKLPDESATPAAVAAWMLSELETQKGVLYQDDAASQIADLFGKKFVYQNESGNDAIDRKVLTAFRKLTGDKVVWMRGEQFWRYREAGDEKTRLQE